MRILQLFLLHCDLFCRGIQVRDAVYRARFSFVVLTLSSVFRVPGCRSRGPGSIPGATRLIDKYWVCTASVV
jgi:hypothetical protein